MSWEMNKLSLCVAVRCQMPSTDPFLAYRSRFKRSNAKEEVFCEKTSVAVRVTLCCCSDST